MNAALLIDGENVSSSHAPAVLDAAPTGCTVRRVYGDVTKLDGWSAVPGLRAVHAAPGRNSADILLAVEAMELFHRAGCRSFWIVTSDGGLSHLAMHLREAGADVTVLAEPKAGPALRAAGMRFADLGALSVARPKALPAPAPGGPKMADAKPELLDFVTGQLREAGCDGLPLTSFNALVLRGPGISIGSLPEGNWRAWLTADCPKAQFDLDPRGPRARVCLKPAAPLPS